jgi:hypothetical protein
MVGRRDRQRAIKASPYNYRCRCLAKSKEWTLKAKVAFDKNSRLYAHIHTNP